MTFPIRKCLELHLVDKAKNGNQVPAADWYDVADQHLKSAQATINSDPNGALILCWAALHKTAKGLAAVSGCRLHDETHGKVADFLICVFEADLTDRERGLIRTIQAGRNLASYDSPKLVAPA